MSDHFVDLIPFWIFFALTCLVTLGAIELGLWLGAWRRRKAEHEQAGPVGSVVGSVLGLLAFIMAFTFGVAATRYDSRRGLLLDEVNAIGTTWLRAGLLPEPHRAQTRSLLREYVDLRVDLAHAIKRPDGLRKGIARAEALQDTLWSHVTTIAEMDRGDEINALFISALNEMLDLHTKRVVLVMYRIPVVVWGVLVFVSLLAMTAVGFHFGLNGRRSFFANLALALSFSAILLLINDLDRPLQGWLTVNQRPMIDLQQKLNAQKP